MVFVPQKSIEQVDPPRSPKETLPTMYDLPSEDPEEPGLPDEFHDLQPQLLSRTLWLIHRDREHCFTASDLNLYYDVKHPLWHKRPDWFLVVDVPRLYDGCDLRRSYVIWQEGQSPSVVVEFLSPGTEREDLGPFYQKDFNGEEVANEIDEEVADEIDLQTGVPSNGESNGESNSKSTPNLPQRLTRPKPPGKFEVYEQYLRIPHYIVYSRYTQQLRYFKLDGGQYRQQQIQLQNPGIWLADLEVGLGIWDGVFEGVPSHWLRWCDRNGNWLLTDTEQKQLEKEQAQLEKKQAQLEKEQAQLEREQAQLEKEQAQLEKEQAQLEKEQAQLEKEQAQLEKEQAQLEKEQAQAQLRQAVCNLLATGMEASQVAQILGLSDAQVQAFVIEE
jgi:Uma2 family endonuclease